VLLSLASHGDGGLLVWYQLGIHIALFEACSAFTHIMACALGLVGVLHGGSARRRFIPMFAAGYGRKCLVEYLLHPIEVEIWTSTYLLLGALPDHNAAMLYSLNSMTTYGHAALYLEGY
jgi:hypothetical protein